MRKVLRTAVLLLLLCAQSRESCGQFLDSTNWQIPGIEVTEEIPPHERADISPDIAELVVGSSNFALELYRRLASETAAGQNMLASPYSITSALGMTYAGARGRTAEQMADVLRFTLPDMHLYAAAGELMRDLDATRAGYSLSIANRLFAQEGFELKHQFLNTTSQHYAAPVEELDFARDPENSRIHINDWVAEKTNDKIRDLLPQGTISNDTALVLTNAIYFDGKWKHKFDEVATHEAPFHGVGGRATQVDMMAQQQVFRYGEFDGYKMLEMPYAGDDLSMVIMLPNAADGLAAFEALLNSEMLAESLDSMQYREVLTYLPKFKFDASFSLAGTLQDMGMTDAFSLSADFSGIADANLAISDVLHKAFIDVNESGTEAAAATAVVIQVTSACYNCNPTPPAVFRADHPFMFALRDTHSGSLLFLGRVAQPGESTIGGQVQAAVPEPGSAMLLVSGLLAFALKRGRERALCSAGAPHRG